VGQLGGKSMEPRLILLILLEPAAILSSSDINCKSGSDSRNVSFVFQKSAIVEKAFSITDLRAVLSSPRISSNP
jgi:hypothetical protein